METMPLTKMRPAHHPVALKTKATDPISHGKCISLFSASPATLMKGVMIAGGLGLMILHVLSCNPPLSPINNFTRNGTQCSGMNTGDTFSSPLNLLLGMSSSLLGSNAYTYMTGHSHGREGASDVILNELKEVLAGGEDDKQV
jgi:hypothetical protein